MIQQELEQLLLPLLNDLGYELWGCEYLAQGKHSLLRIYIDKAEGIHIEDCERVSHQVSALLDVEDPIAANYSLEVSSPGIPRPLFKPWQFARYIGESIEVKTFKSVANRRKITGILVSATDTSVMLNSNGENLELLFANIVKAYLTV